MNHIDHKDSEDFIGRIIQAFIGLVFWIFGMVLKRGALFLWQRFRELDKKPLFVMYMRRTTSYILFLTVVLLVILVIYGIVNPPEHNVVIIIDREDTTEIGQDTSIFIRENIAEKDSFRKSILDALRRK